MAQSEVSPGVSPQSSVPDIQMLSALLGNLMPLLLRVQPAGPGVSSSYATSYSAAPVPQTVSEQLLAQGPVIDHQAAVSLVQNITADSLRTLSSYLERHSSQSVGLEGCIGIVTHAARAFAARDYGQSFALIWQAYRVITAIRTNNPDLPPIRAASAVQPASQSTATH